MTERERKLKNKIQWFVASSVAVFFCLVLSLTVLIAIRINQNKMESSLKAAQGELLKQIDDEERNLKYLESQKFIDEYILKKWGYGKDGTIKF